MPYSTKRWRITTETQCTLCSKDVCTTVHILGACKASLLQGKYTFRHDTVLRQVIEALKIFTSNIKKPVPIIAKTSIKFVKKAAKEPHKRTPPVSILHHTSDWVLIVDLNSNCSSPVHTAFTQLTTNNQLILFNMYMYIYIYIYIYINIYIYIYIYIYID